VKKRWIFLAALAIAVAVLLRDLAAAPPSRRKMASWLEEGDFQTAVVELRAAEEDGLWAMEMDGKTVWRHSRGQPLLEKDAPLADEPFAAAVKTLMADHGITYVTAAYDSRGNLAVTFGVERYHREDTTKDGAYLVWIDPGYNGRRKGQPELGLNAGRADEVLRWAPEDHQLTDSWYFWSVSNELYC